MDCRIGSTKCSWVCVDAAQAEAKTTRVAMVEALAAEQLAAVAAQEAMHEYLVEQLGEMEKQYQVYSMGIEEEFNAQIQTLKENKQNIIAVEVDSIRAELEDELMEEYRDEFTRLTQDTERYTEIWRNNAPRKYSAPSRTCGVGGDVQNAV